MAQIDKPLKVIWLINGILLLFIGILTATLIVIDLTPVNYDSYDNDLIVGDRLEEAKEQGLKLQGLTYSKPQHISHSNISFMTVTVINYQDPEILEIPATLMPSYGMKLNLDYSLNSYDDFNVIFMDSDYQVSKTLLDKKANIAWLKIDEPDSTKSIKLNDVSRHIVYKIAFEDSNEDGLLNGLDLHDLYFSSLSGNNLKQISSNMDIEEVAFIDSYKKLFITYYERNNKKAEHKRKKFAIYDFETAKLKLLSNLDTTIDKLENLLTE